MQFLSPKHRLKGVSGLHDGTSQVMCMHHAVSLSEILLKGVSGLHENASQVVRIVSLDPHLFLIDKVGHV